MESVLQQVSAAHKKKAVVDVRSGDTVRVHQKIREGGKERIQVFEGLVIKASRKDSLTSTFAVRRIASGIGVEKSFLIHSPNVVKIEIVKRSKVRRNYLTYMRALTGKSTRLAGVDFDKDAVNTVDDGKAEAEEAKIAEAQEAEHAEADAKKAADVAEQEAKVEAVLAARDVDAPAEVQKTE